MYTFKLVVYPGPETTVATHGSRGPVEGGGGGAAAATVLYRVYIIKVIIRVETVRRDRGGEGGRDAGSICSPAHSQNKSAPPAPGLITPPTHSVYCPTPN